MQLLGLFKIDIINTFHDEELLVFIGNSLQQNKAVDFCKGEKVHFYMMHILKERKANLLYPLGDDLADYTGSFLEYIQIEVESV
jgi:hypothetical protein